MFLYGSWETLDEFFVGVVVDSDDDEDSRLSNS